MEVRKAAAFDTWLRKLRDERAKGRILVRIALLASGNPGDAEPVGDGVSELRIDYGPGYRLYFVYRGGGIVVLLTGGDKSTQERDIAKAKDLAKNL